MAQSNNNPSVAKKLLVTALLLMAAGLFFGLTGAIQYILPGFLQQPLSFEKIRPLHVSSMVFWIILAASGAIVSYMQEHSGKAIYSYRLANFQWKIFSFTIVLIFLSYFNGKFGGREYWEFPPVLALPIVVSWLFFLFNFLKTIGSFKEQPVYVWMWLTGILFFLFTYVESYLWVFPYFRDNLINDMTIQWKSYGSMVGAWNMLIYGSSIFLMGKLTDDKTYGRSKISFLLYFIGLFNLMFNWGHHIYTLPGHHFIQEISYAVSMTELFIFGRILFQCTSFIAKAKTHANKLAYRFLIAADVWVFLSLALSILMSIPAINVYTHGTHITVAHAMGTTIGINSFLLLAFCIDILKDSYLPMNIYRSWFKTGFWIANLSLLVFWISLITAGILKSKWQMHTPKTAFADMMLELKPCFIVIASSGFMMVVGFLFILFPLIKNQLVGYYLHRLDH